MFMAAVRGRQGGYAPRMGEAACPAGAGAKAYSPAQAMLLA